MDGITAKMSYLGNETSNKGREDGTERASTGEECKWYRAMALWPYVYQHTSSIGDSRRTTEASQEAKDQESRNIRRYRTTNIEDTEGGYGEKEDESSTK